MKKLSFEETVTLLGRNLRGQLEKIKDSKESERNLVADQILFIESGEQIKKGKDINGILTHELESIFKITDFSPATLPNANYLLTGAISPTKSRASEDKVSYELTMVVLDLATGKIAANATVGINEFAFEPLMFYQDSPFFLLDKSVMFARTYSHSTVNQTASNEFMQFLKEKAKIQYAIALYEKGQYAEAAVLFAEVNGSPVGKTLTSCIGEYLAHEKLHQDGSLGRIFTEALDVATAEKQHIYLKIQFKPDSPAFLPEENLAKQYAWVLKNLALYLRKKNVCIDISVHTSRSDKPEGAIQLSLSRAKTIQGIMAVTYPAITKKSQTVGKGFTENIIGSGANDISDAIDRRVELSISACGGKSKPKPHSR